MSETVVERKGKDMYWKKSKQKIQKKVRDAPNVF